MKIKEAVPFGQSKWVDEYLKDKSNIHSFYAYAPIEEGIFSRRVSDLNSTHRMQAGREELAQVITSFHEPELFHVEVKRNIERLKMADSMVVIGGHQACLLTGPLYTIYKAITIIQLAQREEKRLGRPVVPVFWIAGEDHDWDEVNHIWINSSVEKPFKVGFPPSYNRKLVSEIWCNPEEIHSWLNELSQLLPDSTYKNEWINTIKNMVSTKITWTRFFARVMMHLFGKYGLLLIDAADPKLRKLETPFWEVLITQNVEIQRLIAEKSSLVSSNGYTVPVEEKPCFAHLFICRNGHRYPLFFDGEKWTAADSNREWQTSEMLHLARTSPESLSNNVLTRPLMQEYLFPTLAFVGGSAEISYWGLLKDVFTACGLKMPIVHPRMQVTLLTDAIQKDMRYLELTLSDVYSRFTQMKEAWFGNHCKVDLDELIMKAREDITRIHEQLLRELDHKLGINLMESGQLNENKLVEHLTYLQKHTEQILRFRNRNELKKWDEIFNAICPRNKPQERVYNLINYWNLFGLEWIDQLLTSPLLTETSNSYALSIR